MATSLTRRGRRAQPGSRRAVLGVIGILLVALGAVGVVRVATSASRSSTSTYGGASCWLPKSSAPVGRMLQASPDHPVLGIEGDAAHILISSGGADIVAVGPQVPESGGSPVPTTSPVTFNVTIDDVTGVIPLSAGEFVILDELGHFHHPVVTDANGSPLPTRLAAGHKLELEVEDNKIPTGSGDLQWKPISGHPLVSWDFDVEIDEAALRRTCLG